MIKEIRYVKHVLFHPFDGFYDLKHEQRGSLRVAVLIMAMMLILSILQRQLTGFIFNVNRLESLNIMTEVLNTVIPFLLFCVANWAVTTLLDGEGGFKDIVIYVAYAYVPAVILGFLFLIASNVLTLREIAFLRYINVFSAIWVGFMMFIGTLVTHQYTIRRTVLVFILIVLSMGIMLFGFILFFTLIDRFISFINTIMQEISLRQ